MLGARRFISAHNVAGRSLMILGLSLILLSLSGGRPARAVDWTIEVVVDRFDDTNDPSAQVCSEDEGDCSLRGAITNSNLNGDGYYTIYRPIRSPWIIWKAPKTSTIPATWTSARAS